MDMVNVGGYYVTAEEAQGLLEDAEWNERCEQEYYETYRAFDGRTGRDYVKDKTLQHPFPVAFKHFHQTIGLDPEEAHLLACGENRFELISDNFDDGKRALASKFYDWLIEHNYWKLSGIVEYDPGITLEPSVFSFLEISWELDYSHPLHEKLKEN